MLWCADAPTIPKFASLLCCFNPFQSWLTFAGLQPNETYMFAVAAYDADHKLISELGQSAGPVAALLPLPLLHLWCHLALTAAHLGVGTVTHLAASVVLPHFITEEPDCPVWEANPLDRQTINRSATPPSANKLFAYTFTKSANGTSIGQPMHCYQRPEPALA